MPLPRRPLASFVLAAYDAERFLAGAVESALAQSLDDLELVVVDDGSTDGTAAHLEQIRDPRLVVLRNDQRQGLARSLNRGLDEARGLYVARLDADDVALPERVARQVEHLRSVRAGIVGSAVVDIDEAGRLGRLRELPADPVAVRWHALFSSPFYHPTVLIDRDVLVRHGLRYDPEYEESEDYELWTRLLTVADGANLRQPLVLYRVHPGQATQARRDLQRTFQLRVALRGIASVAPALQPPRAELAWRVGSGEPIPSEQVEDAVAAHLELLEAFRAQHEGRDLEAVLSAVARAVIRAAAEGDPATQMRAAGRGLALRPSLPLDVAAARTRRRLALRAARGEARKALSGGRRSDGKRPIRVAVVSPEPTPYRAPVFDLLARRPELDLTVLYSGRSLMERTWHVEPQHRAVFLPGLPVPGARRLLHHDFPVTPAVFRELAAARPDVVVATGWSTFASQAAVAWCRARGVPYILEVDSHDHAPRAGWRRMVREAVVPPVVRGAAGLLATGSLVTRSLVARGASPERIRRFPVTIDPIRFGEEADTLAPRRPELRRALGLGSDDVAVLSVARLSPEKGLSLLLTAMEVAGDDRLVAVVVGSGPERDRLETFGRSLGVWLILAGARPWEDMVEIYVAADVFALLSDREPWGVVVNEAAACGLPLVLSDRVGAAADLLLEGENGFVVPAGDPTAAAEALRRLAADPHLRSRFGARSREVMQDWGYGPSVESFIEAVQDATERT